MATNKHIYDVKSVSVKGHKHVLDNIPVQDSSSSFQEGNKYFITVSDGHGSEKHFRSDRGSKFAVNAAKKVFFRFLNSRTLSLVDNFERHVLLMEQEIYALWTESIYKDIEKHPYESDEKFLALSERHKETVKREPLQIYGCTLLCAFLTNTYHFVLKIGDGNVVIVDQNNNAFEPQELVDEANEFNATASLCRDDFVNHFRFYLNKGSQNLPKGIFLFTDGVINSLAQPEMILKIAQNIIRNHAADKGSGTIRQVQFFLEKTTLNGNGDDVSCAFMIEKNN